METKFEPMRSLIFVHCPKEKYRNKLQHWMYYHHVPESIAKFRPFVTQYTYYWALPVPEEGQKVGGRNFCLTEHYWLINPLCEQMNINALAEYMPTSSLVLQGHLTEDAADQNFEGNAGRSVKGNEDDGTIPFVWVFIPYWWEEDLKGAMRTLEDGYNYRWLFAVGYPEGVSTEEGDKWLKEEFLPAFVEQPEVHRVLTSSIMKDINDSPLDRLCEVWVEDCDEWSKAFKKAAETVKKPEWATEEEFPYLKAQTQFVSMFLSDMPGDDHYDQYRGYKPMR